MFFLSIPSSPVVNKISPTENSFNVLLSKTVDTSMFELHPFKINLLPLSFWTATKNCELVTGIIFANVPLQFLIIPTSPSGDDTILSFFVYCEFAVIIIYQSYIPFSYANTFSIPSKKLLL